MYGFLIPKSHKSFLFVIVDGLFLFEVDRLLSPDGFFVWTMSSEKIATEKMLQSIDNVARSICWTPISNKDSAIVWRKTSGSVCTR